MSIDLQARVRILEGQIAEARETYEFKKSNSEYGSRGEMMTYHADAMYWKKEVNKLEADLNNLMAFGS